ncbi:hypothetical protein D9756_006810 [Leucocoprinus leucothites]|uniref:L-lactate dehydrogenase (cytochrome) n=1 Tax=Leucocoprinus leucothites TaxID=201217 RepID=A0A8H5G2L0_9AGAR|nr:hypothetical protein D9756_006810 [Leucoagaricus leucothites]
MPAWTLDQVAQHSSSESCWVIIQDHVYDVTEFLPEHPGGADIILKHAGRDATAVYIPIHPSDALDKNLPPTKHLGPISAEASQSLASAQKNRKKTKDEQRVEEAAKRKPPLSRILSLRDMESVALRTLSSKAKAFYTSAADDEITFDENVRAFSRFFFNARVMRPVSRCDPSTTILGFKSSIPVFVSGAALAKLGHPEGEANITRGAAQTGITQMVSFNASLSYSDMMDAAVPSQALFFQLYKHIDDSISEERVREADALGYKAIFLTVDTVTLGNRERDVRNIWEAEDEERGAPTYWSENDAPEGETVLLGTAGSNRSLEGFRDQDMTWERTIPWLRRITKLPIVLKGIQCVEDAVLAAEAGVEGILLSNHGGRQLEYSMPPLEVLYKIRLQRPDVFEKLEVYIDGGISRGTDVIKALCLGAKAVGLGRAFLYAQSVYGAAGVVKIVQILRKEIVTAMRLVGASTIDDLRPEMEHPGGANIILKHAGRDATAVYVPIHPSDALEKNLPPAKHLGLISAEASQSLASAQKNRKKTKDEQRVEEAAKRKPPLSRILSLGDMETVALQTISSKAKAFYTSAADDEITFDENARAFSRFFFNARVMRPVSECDPSTTILGFESSIPVFVSGAALAKLGHPEGEANITRGAAQTGITQMVSFNSSLSYSDMMDAAIPSQALFFQLYKHVDDSISEKQVREADALGYKAIFLTVDTVVTGNRERDIRNVWESEDEEKGAPRYWSESDIPEEETIPAGTARTNRSLGAFKDKDMTWDKTIPWLRKITKLPIVIKGIQCVEDAVLAAEAGVQGILLSNHGGRQLEYSMPPLEVLYRIRLQRPDVFDKVEVYIDGALPGHCAENPAQPRITGGVSRGTDVIKALCLGAKAVGLGRPFLYAQSAYGVAGVVKIVQILRKEIVTAMRLIGASTIGDLCPEMVERVDWQPRLPAKL